MDAVMSRSRRKTQILSRTTARSEKADKQQLNRALRSRNRQRIKEGRWDDLFRPNDLMTEWEMSKDGRHYYDFCSFIRWRMHRFCGQDCPDARIEFEESLAKAMRK